MIELNCKSCAAIVSADDAFCCKCGARPHAEPAAKMFTIYFPVTCPDESLVPLYDKMLVAMKEAGRVHQEVIQDPSAGEAHVYSASFDTRTLKKKLEGVPFWLRKMIGL